MPERRGCELDDSISHVQVPVDSLSECEAVIVAFDLELLGHSSPGTTALPASVDYSFRPSGCFSRGVPLC